MMKILSINQKYEVHGGSDRYFFNLNELLAANGHSVYDFAARGNLESSSNFHSFFPEQVKFDYKSPFNLINYLYNYEAKNKLSDMLESIGNADLAHLQIYYGQLTVSIVDLLKSKGIPIIQTLHEYKFSCPVYTHLKKSEICHDCTKFGPISCVKNMCKDDSVIKSIVRYLEFKFSKFKGDRTLIDQFICVSNFQKNLMIEAGVPEDKLNVVYNFVQAKNIKLNSSNDGYYLYFGRLEQLKGLTTLLEAAKLLQQYRFVIAGDGPYKTDLIKFIKDNSLKNIEFVGFKNGSELWDMLARSKAVIVPSEWYENCSMTVLEAKAYYKPVIASAIGGITEQITNTEDGFLFAPKDISGLVGAIENLESLTENEYREMSLKSRADLDERYSADVHYSNLLSVYGKVL
ncbi:MAG: glycosyltransferase family 4 protein [Mesoflavibacter sp.]|nr:glycosyltransferase family 4 protein [Mesoflavibacter sp.]MCP4264448.1 glycosyltransferase family 4 protein [Candidatus Brocadiaceae bacterium]